MRIFLLTLLHIFHSFLCNSQYLSGSIMESAHRYAPTKPELIVSSSARENNFRANKNQIDTSSIAHWFGLSTSDVKISERGNFYSYAIENFPYGHSTLIVSSIDNSWRKDIIDIAGGSFSSDEEEFIYLRSGKLNRLKLGTDQRSVVDSVANFEFGSQDNRHILLYKKNTVTNELVSQNLSTGETYSVQSVIDYKFDPSSGVLILLKDSDSTSVSKLELQLMQASDGSTQLIYKFPPNSTCTDFYLDGLRKQVVWLVNNKSCSSCDPDFSIYFTLFNSDSPQSVLRSNDSIPGGLQLFSQSSPVFTQDGRYISFWAKERTFAQTPEPSSGVDVWNTKDSLLQSVQLFNIAKNITPKYECVISLEKLVTSKYAKVIRLMERDESAAISQARFSAGDYFLAKRVTGGDRFWETTVTFDLVSMKDGRRKRINSSNEKLKHFYWSSPGGRYLIHFRSDGHYYAYDLSQNTVLNISKNVNQSLVLNNLYYKDDNTEYPVGIGGWLGRDESVLIYDNFDIWQVDLSGMQKPINLTHREGLINNFKLRAVQEGAQFQFTDTILISAFDPIKKKNGLCTLAFSSGASISKLKMEDDCIYFSDNPNQGATAMLHDLLRPVKAEKGNRWIVMKESATDPPNLFYTSDFRSYDSLTDLHPHENYSWITCELLRWRQADGTLGQGILYRPEKFDSEKKYPLILSYYEQFSSSLYQFPNPHLLNSTQIDVTWFVSHGYLVFRPDINYTAGRLIESTCNSVVSAAESLSLLPYVDSKKIGIAGFSWGGTQTNWLITQSNLFAAAATGGAGRSGSDLFSVAFQTREIRGVKEDAATEPVEEHSGGLYFDNQLRWQKISPVWRADKVVTPLLMLQNYGDYHWQQSAEFFIALRRMGKKAWMLQYDQGSHGLFSSRDVNDYTIRTTQFFNHYLKDVPAPIWMTQGIPAKLKGIETGYALDPAGNCSKDCKVCKKWNEKWNTDSTAVKEEMKQWEKW